MVFIASNDELYFDLLQITISFSPKLKYEKKIIHIGRAKIRPGQTFIISLSAKIIPREIWTNLHSRKLISLRLK